MKLRAPARQALAVTGIAVGALLFAASFFVGLSVAFGVTVALIAAGVLGGVGLFVTGMLSVEVKR